MTVSQAHSFLAAATGTPLEAIWAVMLYLGLRPGEVAALAWSDIDVTNPVGSPTDPPKVRAEFNGSPTHSVGV